MLHVDAIPVSVREGRVAVGAVFGDVVQGVVEMCVFHTEWLEDVLLGILAEALLSHPLDDDGGQKVAGIARLVALARIS